MCRPPRPVPYIHQSGPGAIFMNPNARKEKPRKNIKGKRKENKKKGNKPQTRFLRESFVVDCLFSAVSGCFSLDLSFPPVLSSINSSFLPFSFLPVSKMQNPKIVIRSQPPKPHISMPSLLRSPLTVWPAPPHTPTHPPPHPFLSLCLPAYITQTPIHHPNTNRNTEPSSSFSFRSSAVSGSGPRPSPPGCAGSGRSSPSSRT